MIHISELVCSKLREIHPNSEFQLRKTHYDEYHILYGKNRILSFDKILGIKGLDDYSLLEYYTDIDFLPFTSKPLDEIFKEIKKISSILNILFCVLSNKKYTYLPICFKSVSYLIYKNYKDSLYNDGEYIEFRWQDNNNVPKIFFNLCLYFIPEIIFFKCNDLNIPNLESIHKLKIDYDEADYDIFIKNCCLHLLFPKLDKENHPFLFESDNSFEDKVSLSKMISI